MDTFRSMKKSETDIDTDQHAHLLTVIAGVQEGAEAQIPTGTCLTVGTELENDIVLFSAAGDKACLELTADEYNVTLIVNEGEIFKNNELLDVGETYTVQNMDVFLLGSSQFTVAISSSSLRESEVVNDENSSFSNHTESTSFMRARPWQIFCLGTGLLLMIFAITTDFVRATNDGAETQSFEQQLAMSGFEHLNYIEPTEDVQGKVTGTVVTSEEKSRVLALVAERNPGLTVDLQVNEDISSTIKDLYRVNGVKADVTVTGLGEVNVWTSSSNEELLSSIESSIREDIPDIVSLNATNVRPEEKVIVEKDDPVTITDPDKQVTLVVAGANGYLMTKDKSRYFVGSMLPSGHIIESIEAGNVYVKSNGKLERLEF